MPPKTILIRTIGVIRINDNNTFLWLLAIIPLTLIIFYVIALILGMKPLGRSRVGSQIFGRLLNKIDPTDTPSSSETPPPPPAALIFMALILVTIFGLAFAAIALWIIELFN
jgi:hypothetical protein